MNLSIGALKGDVVCPLHPGELAGPLNGRRRDVDPERTACPGDSRGFTGCPPAPASDIQHMLAALDTQRPTKYLVVQPQFGVVIDGPSLQVLPAGPQAGNDYAGDGNEPRSSQARHRAFARVIWCGVWQDTRIRSGLATMTAIALAREVATFSRCRS